MTLCITVCKLTLSSYGIISEDEAEERKLAPIEVVYVGSGGTGISPKTGRKGMLCLLYTFTSLNHASKLLQCIFI